MMTCSARRSTSTPAGAGRAPPSEGQRLQEGGAGRRLGDDRREVAGRGHEAVSGLREGRIAGADGPTRAVEAILAGGEADAGGGDRGLAVVADADGQGARIRFIGGDAEGVQEAAQRRRDARLRPHKDGQGEGLEGHASATVAEREGEGRKSPMRERAPRAPRKAPVPACHTDSTTTKKDFK